jgi:DNA-directed RNA polymerase I, II, and III subunit RPABC1
MYKIRQVCFDLLENRGYVVASGEREISYDEFREFFSRSIKKEELTILAFKKLVPNVQIFVFFHESDRGTDRISRNTISKYYERMKKEGVSRSILVVTQKLSSQAVKSLELIAKGTDGAISIEVFQESELLVNVTQHVFVPKHRVLTQDEKYQLLERYKVVTRQLPCILKTDPVARYLGLESGDIVKILRPSETAGHYVTYRACK